jgi:hypothetical protein
MLLDRKVRVAIAYSKLWDCNGRLAKTDLRIEKERVIKCIYGHGDGYVVEILS